MALTFYLIGTNHAHQLENHSDGKASAFANYLCGFCFDNNIDLLAEELNEDAIAKWNASGSVARSVALKLSISHLFCDPNCAERRQLGMPTDKEIAKKLGFNLCCTQQQAAQVDDEARKYWSIRENFWLENLRQSSFKRCAFILGGEHVRNFEALLNSQGFIVNVEQANWVAPDKVKI